ncbi:hypothetical protein WA158_000942 [Blastocystis sp. Blastoise]
MNCIKLFSNSVNSCLSKCVSISQISSVSSVGLFNQDFIRLFGYKLKSKKSVTKRITLTGNNLLKRGQAGRRHGQTVTNRSYKLDHMEPVYLKSGIVYNKYKEFFQ